LSRDSMTGIDLLEQELLRVLSRGARGQEKRIRSVQQAFLDLDEDLRSIMEHYIDVNVRGGLSVSDLAQAYVFFLAENDKEEKYFFEHGRYRYDCLQDVQHKVYENGEYMQKYMVGLAVSMILWPQHREYFRFFSHFIDLCNHYRGKYLEVGAGHGLFVSEALRRGNFTRYDILDISEKSLELTKRMTAEYSAEKNIQFIHDNFLQYSGMMYDVVSIGEVLEHVENPVDFLGKCREILADEGRAYLTTCINAPEVDHIYLFSAVDEVENMFAEVGMEIEEKLYITYRGYDMERCERQKLPVNVAYILKRG